MKVGLFFGSFNPVHIGHMIIASHMVDRTDLSEVWLVISPQNPFKKKKSLASEYDRYYLVQQAIGDNPKIRASNIEFSLPKPSYTIDTLAYLHEKYPSYDFAIIMGGDNLRTFHKWKNYRQILDHHDIYVYQRPQHKIDTYDNHPRVFFAEAPMIHLSATYIREAIRLGYSIQYLVPDLVYEELLNSNLYRH